MRNYQQVNIQKSNIKSNQTYQSINQYQFGINTPKYACENIINTIHKNFNPIYYGKKQNCPYSVLQEDKIVKSTISNRLSVPVKINQEVRTLPQQKKISKNVIDHNKIQKDKERLIQKRYQCLPIKIKQMMKQDIQQCLLRNRRQFKEKTENQDLKNQQNKKRQLQIKKSNFMRNKQKGINFTYDFNPDAELIKCRIIEKQTGSYFKNIEIKAKINSQPNSKRISKSLDRNIGMTKYKYAIEKRRKKSQKFQLNISIQQQSNNKNIIFQNHNSFNNPKIKNNIKSQHSYRKKLKQNRQNLEIYQQNKLKPFFQKQLSFILNKNNQMVNQKKSNNKKIQINNLNTSQQNSTQQSAKLKKSLNHSDRNQIMPKIY